MIPHTLGTRLATSLLGASFNITPNSSLPGSSQVTSFLGGIEQWAVYACLLGLIIGGAGLWWGSRTGPSTGPRSPSTRCWPPSPGGHHRGRGLPHHLGLQLRQLGQL